MSAGLEKLIKEMDGETDAQKVIAAASRYGMEIVG